MSYGIGIVILKDDLNKEKIRYDFCDWTLPIAVLTYPETCKKNFKERWYPSFEKENKYTSIEKLKSAPCDCVCIIDKEGNFETLKGCTPINSQNISIKEYLNI